MQLRVKTARQRANAFIATATHWWYNQSTDPLKRIYWRWQCAITSLSIPNIRKLAYVLFGMADLVLRGLQFDQANIPHSFCKIVFSSEEKENHFSMLNVNYDIGLQHYSYTILLNTRQTAVHFLLVVVIHTKRSAIMWSYNRLMKASIIAVKKCK